MRSSGWTSARSSADARLVTTKIDSESEPLLVEAIGDDLVKPDEGATADEEDIGCIDLQEFLVRVLAPTLWRNIRHRTLEDLEQRLLDSLA